MRDTHHSIVPTGPVHPDGARNLRCRVARAATPVLLVALFAGSLRAQSGYLVSYGAACAGASNVPPGLSGTGYIAPGASVTLNVTGPANSVGAIGFSNASASFPLRPGCDLLISLDPVHAPITLAIATNGSGSATLPIAFSPSSPALVGTRLYSQVVLIDPVTPNDLAVSNAQELIGGPRIFRSNGLGGGAWNAASTWNLQPGTGAVGTGIPGIDQDYDVVVIRGTDTVTQGTTLPKTLGLYVLDPGATHVLTGTTELKAMTVEALGTIQAPPPVAGVYDSPTVVVRNAADVMIRGDVNVQREFDDPGYCNLVNAAPPPFASYGPCTDAPASTGGAGQGQGQGQGQGADFDENTTHPALTAVSMGISQNVLNPPEDYLVKQLAMTGGIDTVVNGFAGPMPVWAYVIRGVVDEDHPLSRVLNHFLNPYTEQGLFAPTPGHGSAADVWALNDPGNQFNFVATRAKYLEALTRPLLLDRERSLGLALEGIGHVIHLIQDMAASPHCRTDAHYSFRPVENHAQHNYGTVAQLDALAEVQTIPAAPLPPRYQFTGTVPVVRDFRKFWDTNQLTALAPFGGFGVTPGLAELVNVNFWSDDTVLDPKHPRPSVADTNLAALFPPPPQGQVVYGSNSEVPTPLAGGWVAVNKPAGAGGINVPVIGAARSLGAHPIRSWFNGFTSWVAAPQRVEVSINNVTAGPGPASVLDSYSRGLLPLAIGYSTSFVNYFFRGKVDIRIAWVDAIGQYRLTVTNRSGEPLGAGTWRIYQDDNNNTRNRALLKTMAYPGSLANGASFQDTFLPMANRNGSFMLVFNGTIGSEVATGVIGKSFDVLSVRTTWSPNADGDIYMWDFDNNLIWDANKVGPYGEHDVDDGVGDGPEGITVHTFKANDTLQFMVNYGEDWHKERTWNGAGCTTTATPQFAMDDPADPCFTQTTNNMTVRVYYNSQTPITPVVVRTLTMPGDRANVPPNFSGVGPQGQSWYVTLVVSVNGLYPPQVTFQQ